MEHLNSTTNYFSKTSDNTKASNSQESFFYKLNTEFETTETKSESSQCGFWDLTRYRYSKTLNETSDGCWQRPLHFNSNTETGNDAPEEMNRTLESENDCSRRSCSDIVDPVRQARLLMGSNHDGRGSFCSEFPTSMSNKPSNRTKYNSYACSQRPLYFNIETVPDTIKQMNKVLKSENDGSRYSYLKKAKSVKETSLVTGSTHRLTESGELSPDLQDLNLDFQFFQTLDEEKFFHMLNDLYL